jgi:hypothetical protein
VSFRVPLAHSESLAIANQASCQLCLLAFRVTLPAVFRGSSNQGRRRFAGDAQASRLRTQRAGFSTQPTSFLTIGTGRNPIRSFEPFTAWSMSADLTGWFATPAALALFILAWSSAASVRFLEWPWVRNPPAGRRGGTIGFGDDLCHCSIHRVAAVLKIANGLVNRVPFLKPICCQSRHPVPPDRLGFRLEQVLDRTPYLRQQETEVLCKMEHISVGARTASSEPTAP